MLGKKPPKELVANWKRMEALHKDMGHTILELMAHPNATLEQLWLARLQYADNIAELKDMRATLRKHFKDGPYLSEKYPWNQ
jgi:hypothetical protein